MRQGDMSNWMHLVVCLIHSLSNAERVFYVNEDTVAADQAASMCNLATPDIHFWIGWNSVSLDGADLNIAEGESVWSGYVQTYAAFLYEGCCEVEFVNSSAVYTNMYRDPGECYSKCKTEVIGMQTSTCHCNPRPEKAMTYATGCSSTCSNPYDTVCGGERAVSLYRKVQYPGSGRRAETENCRAYFWNYNNQPSFTWRHCLKEYTFLCAIDELPSIKFEWQRPLATWSETTVLCFSYKKTTAVELSSGYPDSNCPRSKLIWIGQIRSRVIGKDADSNNQTPGWRRGVIKYSGGEYLLEFHTNHPHHPQLNSLCEYVSTSAPSSDSTIQSMSLKSTTTTNVDDRNGSEQNSNNDNDQFPMISTSAPSSDSTSATSSDSTIQCTSLKSTTTTIFEGRNGSEKRSNIDNDQFPMIVVYAAVPAVLVLVAVLVIVILCKRKHVSKERTDRHDVHQNSYVTNTTDPSQNSRAPEGTATSARDNEYAVVTKKTKPKPPNTTDDNEYDTTVTFSPLKHTETDNTYNRLDDITSNTNGHIGEGGSNEVDIYDHAVSKNKPLKASKGRNPFQNDTTVTSSSLKLTATDITYNRLDDVTGNNDTHETNGDDVDLYDHAVSNDKPLKASKGMRPYQGGLYDTALAVNRQGETQTSAVHDIYAQPIPRSERK